MWHETFDRDLKWAQEEEAKLQEGERTVEIARNAAEASQLGLEYISSPDKGDRGSHLVPPQMTRQKKARRFFSRIPGFSPAAEELLLETEPPHVEEAASEDSNFPSIGTTNHSSRPSSDPDLNLDRAYRIRVVNLNSYKHGLKTEFERRSKVSPLSLPSKTLTLTPEGMAHGRASSMRTDKKYD
jgi:hypothetical protein